MAGSHLAGEFGGGNERGWCTFLRTNAAKTPHYHRTEPSPLGSLFSTTRIYPARTTISQNPLLCSLFSATRTSAANTTLAQNPLLCSLFTTNRTNTANTTLYHRTLSWVPCSLLPELILPTPHYTTEPSPGFLISYYQN